MSHASLLAAAFSRFNDGDFAAASASFAGLLCLAPNRTDHYFHAALVQHHIGDLPGAAALYQRALNVDQTNVAAHVNRSLVLYLLMDFESAKRHAAEAIKLSPTCAEAYSNLGNALQQLRRLGEAETVLRTAIEISPDFGDAWNNLGNVLLDMGRVAEALHAFAKPSSHREARFNSVFGCLYVNDDPEVAYDAARCAAAKFLAGHLPYDHEKRQRVRPRLGFISGDFRHHPVGLCIIQTMEYLKREGFELVFYATTPIEDVWSWRFQQCGRWVPAYTLNDGALAGTIYEDQIDILFDLSGYTAGHRLEVLARQPAPIQATWFAYPGTTGMPEMDYLIGEPTQTEGLQPYCSERIIELPTMICFEPPDHEPLPELPAIRNGYVTFGSFNVLKKVTPEVVAVWADILIAAPATRLIMKTPALDCPVTRARYQDLFAHHGVDIDRITFHGHTDSVGHRKVMTECDVALDTFPYSGGVTTLECLWMGLPVITMPGKTYQSRHSAHYLRAIEFDQFIASDINQYRRIAHALAYDRAFIAGNLLYDMRALRTIRHRMTTSPLCDISLHGVAFVEVIMGMWRDWK